MVRNTLLILFAIFIDFLQATISLGLFVIGAFPATAAGGAGGCALGMYIFNGSAWVCGFLGSILGLIGAPANAPIAIATLPVAIGLGFVVNFCIDITLGTILTLWLIWEKMYYPGIGITGFIAELIPGLNDLPAWTMMTALSVMHKNAEEGKLVGTAGSAFTTLMTVGTGALSVFALKRATGDLALQRGVFTREQQDAARGRVKNAVSAELRNIDGIRARKPVSYAS